MKTFCEKDVIFNRCVFYLLYRLIQDAEKEAEPAKSEIKVPIPYFVLPFPFHGITYKSLINHKVGLGLTVEPSTQRGKDVLTGDFIHFRISPYCRYYYKSFFIEADVMVAAFEHNNGFGVGTSLGYKYVSKRDFIMNE